MNRAACPYCGGEVFTFDRCRGCGLCCCRTCVDPTAALAFDLERRGKPAAEVGRLVGHLARILAARAP